MPIGARRLVVCLSIAALPACSARVVTGYVERDAAAPVDAVAPAPDVGLATPDRVTPTTDAGFPSFDLGPRRDAGFPAFDLGFRSDLGSPPDAGGPSRAAVVAGRRCTDDSTCFGSAADLSCLPLPGGQVCTSGKGCEQSTTAEEEAQCGGRFSTCLVFGNTAGSEQVSLCTRACVPSARAEAAGACPTGSICTNNWVQLRAGQTENPGCMSFCTVDAHCAGVEGEGGALPRCNVRTGRCAAAPVDDALLADGLPCDPQRNTPGGAGQCRGLCFALSSVNRNQGLCGSFVDTSATSNCADSPQIEVRGPADQNLGLCIFRSCEDNSQCPAGLLCGFPEDASGVRMELPPTCAYATALQPVGIPPRGADAGAPPG